MKSIVFLFPIFLHIMTPLLRYTLSTMLFRVVLLLVETIMMLVAQTGTLYIPVCSVLLFVFFNLVSLNTSSETQGLLDGMMRYFWGKVYFKSWRAPENLFLPNQLHAEVVEFRPADWAEKYFSAYRTRPTCYAQHCCNLLCWNANV